MDPDRHIRRIYKRIDQLLKLIGVPTIAEQEIAAVVVPAIILPIASSTDTAIALWDGTTGDKLMDSLATLSVAGVLNTPSVIADNLTSSVLATFANARITGALDCDGTGSVIDASLLDAALGTFTKLRPSAIELKTTTVSGATHVLTAADCLLHVTRTISGTCNITLPAAEANDGRYILVNDAVGNAGTNSITIVTSGGGLIDSGASVSITTNFGSLHLYSDGVDWFTV